jgi:hypothetical protein
VKLDLDSAVIETYGLQKQCGKHFTYLHTRGYHPVLAVIAETGEVVHSRLHEAGRLLAEERAASYGRRWPGWDGWARSPRCWCGRTRGFTPRRW